MAYKPTVVFVPGAFHTPEYFDYTREKLEKLGYPTRAVNNPSLGPADLPLKSLSDDVSNLRQELDSLSKEGRKIVVIPHSYGGVITSCAVEGFDIASRRKNGLTGGVIAVGYMAAFAIPKGISLVQAVAVAGMKGSIAVQEGNKWRPLNPADQFYGDLSPSEQEKWVSRLSLTTVSAFESKSTWEPWQVMPCTFIFCTEDLAMPISFQREMVLKWGKRPGEVATFTCNSSHSPMLSMPDEVVKAVEMTADVGLRELSAETFGL